MLTESIFEIRELPFINDIKAKGGVIYSVGGAIRDSFLNKQSKDLDILITNIPIPELTAILQKYGKVDMVGVSFGVIKFRPKGESEEIDIAVPRTERKMGDGHKGFEVTADPYLPIETDLSRRDFTINAMAKDIDGNIIDPFHGLQDLKAKVIRIVNPIAFADDPLRMLRAVQFAARFGFTIEPETFKLIQQNAGSIKTISPERILIELEKIVGKGSPAIGAQLLVETGLYSAIFGGDLKEPIASFNNVTMFAEFIYLLTDRNDDGSFFLHRLKGDLQNAKIIAGLRTADSHYLKTTETPLQTKLRMFSALQKSQAILNTKILYTQDRNVLNDFASGKYPKSLKELAVNGTDLMGIGFKNGPEMGVELQSILANVLSDKVRNDHKTIMDLLVSNKFERLK